LTPVGLEPTWLIALAALPASSASGTKGATSESWQYQPPSPSSWGLVARARRGKLAASPDRWWEVDVEPADELWLFTDTDTGLPSRTELLNDRWHRVRRGLARSDPDNAWPAFEPYRNLRHRAASFWHDELDREWADVPAWLGDQLTTVISHYVRSGADALADVTVQLQAY
jgi:hypothetical protein